MTFSRSFSRQHRLKSMLLRQRLDHANLDSHGLFWLNARVLLIYQVISELSLGGIASLPIVAFKILIVLVSQTSNKETVS